MIYLQSAGPKRSHYAIHRGLLEQAAREPTDERPDDLVMEIFEQYSSKACDIILHWLYRQRIPPATSPSFAGSRTWLNYWHEAKRLADDLWLVHCSNALIDVYLQWRRDNLQSRVCKEELIVFFCNTRSLYDMVKDPEMRHGFSKMVYDDVLTILAADD